MFSLDIVKDLSYMPKGLIRKTIYIDFLRYRPLSLSLSHSLIKKFHKTKWRFYVLSCPDPANSIKDWNISNPMFLYIFVGFLIILFVLVLRFPHPSKKRESLEKNMIRNPTKIYKNIGFEMFQSFIHHFACQQK
jgi:hypothetical protein